MYPATGNPLFKDRPPVQDINKFKIDIIDIDCKIYWLQSIIGCKVFRLKGENESRNYRMV
jgi:hypothetical protein